MLQQWWEQEPNAGKIDGFNLNLGCPSDNVIQIGLGCAMVKRISKVNSIISQIQESKVLYSLIPLISRLLGSINRLQINIRTDQLVSYFS